MQPPFPSPVLTWHNDTYAAISPLRAELSSAGKTVIITGAVSLTSAPCSSQAETDRSSIKGSGIGRETAIAFAAAGAKRLVLIGRTDSTLAQAKDSLQASSKSTTCLTFRTDITDDKAMHQIAAEVGTWDIFILNAGHLPNPASIVSANLSDYWTTYEVQSPTIPSSLPSVLRN